MARHSRTGVHGLFRDARGRRWCVDLPMVANREQGMASLSRAAAGRSPCRCSKGPHAGDIGGGIAGGFDPKREKPGLSRKASRLRCVVRRKPAGAAKRRAAVCARLCRLGDLRLDLVSAFHVERFKRID